MITPLDPIIWEFVQGNFVFLTLIFSVLKVVAKKTPWAVDDEIVQIFTNFLNRKDFEK